MDDAEQPKKRAKIEQYIPGTLSTEPTIGPLLSAASTGDDNEIRRLYASASDICAKLSAGKKKKEPLYRPIYSSITPEFFAKILFYQQSIRKNDFVKIFTGNNFENEDIDFNHEEVSDNRDFVVLEFKR